MKMGKLMGRVSAVAALSLAISAAPAAAQSTRDCRCVDLDGNEVERCTCFRTPDVEGLIQSLGFTDARPRLGISVDVRQSARRDAAGALVTDVLEGGPAADAGIRPGDVITSIAGRSLFEPLAGDAEEDFDLDRSVPVQRLLAIAAELEPGEEVEVEYERDGETRTATVEAEDLSESWGRRAMAMGPRFDDARFREQLRELTEDASRLRLRLGDRDDAWGYVPGRGERGEARVFGGGGAGVVVLDALGRSSDGLELVELNPELGSYFGADEGVLVADVDEDSTLGLEPGDVVLRVGDRPVTTPERMRRILRSYGADEEVTLHVRRDGRETTVTGRPGR